MKKNGVLHSGFNQVSFNPSFSNLGVGLNEGYTEVLTHRYFKEGEFKPTKNLYSYEYLAIIATHLEKIVGDKKMTHLYMNANLKDLINEMCKYAEPKDVMEFFAYTDFLYEHVNDLILKYKEDNMILNSLKNVNKFLAISYLKSIIKARKEKLNESKSQEELITEELFNDFQDYISTLPDKLTIKNIEYDLLPIDDIKLYISQALTSLKEEFNNDVKEENYGR